MLLHDYDGKSWQSLMGKEGRNERTAGRMSELTAIRILYLSNGEETSERRVTVTRRRRQQRRQRRHLVDIVAPIAIAKAVVIPERSFSHEFHQ